MPVAANTPETHRNEAFQESGFRLAALSPGEGRTAGWIQKKATAGVILAFVILVGIGLRQYWRLQNFISNDQWVIHTDGVLAELEETLSSIRDVNGNLRDRLIAAHSMPLDQMAMSQTSAHLEKLRQLTADNSSQQQRLDVLEGRVSDFFAAVRQVAALQEHQGMPAVKDFVEQDHTLQRLDEIRNVIQEMEAEERTLLLRRTAVAERSAHHITWFILIGDLLAIFLIMLAGVAIRGDIRAHRRFEEELRLFERKFRSIVNTAQDSIFLLGPRGHVATWNPGAARMKGYREEEILGQHFSKFYTPEDVAAGLPEHVLKVASEDGHFRGEGWRVRKDGSRFWAGVVVTSVKDDAGRVIGFSKVVRDMTERKAMIDKIERYAEQLEERVSEKQEAIAELESFSYSVSHDLRAPLRAIEGFTEALAEDAVERLNEQDREYINEVLSATARMQQLIQDLLDYGRLGRGQIQLVKISVVSAVDQAIRQIGSAKPEIELSINPSLQVWAHEAAFVQAIANLISNAIKFQQPGVPPHVKIFAEEHGPNVRISVADNGIGIARQHWDRIFQVFQRLHTVEEYPGTGIGLAIVRRAISRMGGKIGLESELGKGSTFWIDLRSAGN